MVKTHPDPLDAHDQAEMLLPWYVTGQLSPEDAARVDAHLSACAVCSAQVAGEIHLRDAIASLPLRSETAIYTAFQSADQIPARRRRTWDAPRRMADRVAARPGRFIGLAAAQAAAFAVVFLIARTSAPEPASYTVLGAAPVEAGGNAMIVFRPDVTERELREALNASRAEIVGGPTVTDAYILRLPDSERAALLQTLRATPAVVLAEAIDGETPP